MSCLRCWCLPAHSGVQGNTCCVVLLFCFCSSSVPVSLDCPFFIVPSVFSNVYVPLDLLSIILLPGYNKCDK